MMYCNNCFTAFDENEIDSFDIMCPYCGEMDEIAEAIECKQCGEYYPNSEMKNGYCLSCQKDIIDRFNKSISSFSKDERELITDVYEGIYL